MTFEGVISITIVFLNTITIKNFGRLKPIRGRTSIRERVIYHGHTVSGSYDGIPEQKLYTI